MSKVISLDAVRAAENAELDEVKAEVLEYLDMVRERVEREETVSILMVEFHDEIGEYTTALLGASYHDALTTMGVLRLLQDNLSEDLRD